MRQVRQTLWLGILELDPDSDDFRSRFRYLRRDFMDCAQLCQFLEKGLIPICSYFDNHGDRDIGIFTICRFDHFPVQRTDNGRNVCFSRTAFLGT